MPERPLRRPLQLLLAGLLLGLAACSSLIPRDPPRIDLAGLEPLPGLGLEMRFMALLRIQNPNESALDYDGIALDLALNGAPLASGVSDQQGQVPAFGEALLRVPVTLSAFSAMRQVWAAANQKPGQPVPYELSGKLANGLFGSQRFNVSGTLDWPPPQPQP